MSTAFPLRLTLEQARHSQRCFFIFALLNAFSFAALAESILMLFALKLGATAFEIGLLASYINLTMIFMFLGKFMVSRWGAAKTYGACWLSRNVAAALMIFAPYFYYEYSPSAGLTLLLASSFLFFVFRGMGVAAHNVLLNDITSEQSRGRFMGINSAGTNLVMLSTLIALSFYLKGEPSFLRFQIVVAWGCVMGIASSFAAFAVRESEGPRQSSREPLLWALSLVFQQKGIRRLVLAWIAATIGVQLLIPFQVLAVKKGYLLADAMVVRFVAVQMLGSMAAAYLNSLLLDRAGPRPVLIINVLALAMCSAVWALSPGAVNFVYTDVLFFIAGFCSLTVQICLQHYFLNIVRKQSVVNLSLVVSMLEGACAGLAGTFLGGGVLLLLPQYGLEGMEVYRVYFAGVAVLQLGAALLVRRLQPLVERRVPEVLGMMFSLRDWRAMLSVQRLAQTPELERVETLIDELAILQSNVSEQTLLEYLDSPLFTVRAAAMEALNKIDFSEKCAKRLIEEVERGEFTTAFIAAEMLGHHGVKEAVPALQRALQSEDFFLSGKAMLALAQLGDSSSFAAIIEMFNASDNPRLIIHGARAIAHMRDAGHIALLLTRLDPGLPPAVNDEIMHTVFSLYGWGADNFRLMTLYTRGMLLGIDDLDAVASREIRELGRRMPEKKTLVVKWAIEELNSENGAEPLRLIELFRETAALCPVDSARIEVLLADGAKKLLDASPRLRFNLTALGCLLYLRREKRCV